MRELIVLRGPNGAGKTTAAQIVVPWKLDIAEFVNADEIARGLSPFNPERAAFAAGRLMLERMRRLASGDRAFAVETTCSGLGHINFLGHCKQMGWRITLIFLWLPSPQIALERVAQRVASGGHSVPDETVTRRYWAGLRNMFAEYLPVADVASLYDNGGNEPILIARRARWRTRGARRRTLGTDGKNVAMADLTPTQILDAIDEGVRESALLAALGYDPSQGRLGRMLLNNALERRGYGRPISEQGPDPMRAYPPNPGNWVQTIADAVTGRPDAPIGEIIAVLKHGPRESAPANPPAEPSRSRDPTNG